MANLAASLAPRALSVLRIFAGFLFTCHGFQKLFGLFGGHRVAFLSEPWIGGALEAVGGILIMLGLFTRPVAFVLCGEMAVAYFRFHNRKAFWPILNGGELAVLYCFVFLYLCFAGPGPISLDRLLRRKSV